MIIPNIDKYVSDVYNIPTTKFNLYARAPKISRGHLTTTCSISVCEHMITITANLSILMILYSHIEEKSLSKREWSIMKYGK